MGTLKPLDDDAAESLGDWLPEAFNSSRRVRTELHNPLNILGVKDDIEAIGLWLRERGRNSTNTFDAYKREAEKLLVWASAVKNKGLGELTRNDHLEFQEFLANVPDDWIMPKRFRRSHPNWRPFLEQPSTGSIAHTITILYGMMEYLVTSGWFVANPMPKPKSTIRKAWRPTRKALPQDVVKIILDSTLEPKDGETPKDVLTRLRDRWIIYFMVHLAPRVSETRSLSGKITPELIGEKTIWIWSVVGKGGTEEDLPVPVHVMDELARFRQALDLNPLPGPDDHVPLFPSFRRMKADGSFSDISDPLTRSSVYKRITEHIIPRAKDLAKRRGVSDARLDLVSPHWFRHTALTEILRKSNDLQVAKKLGRHRDINTTAGYTQADLITLHEAMED